MFEINNSTNVSINGNKYDFSGVHAILSITGKIKSVTCIKTGKDLTNEYKTKYGQK